MCDKLQWIDVSEKEPIFEADILFQTANGTTHAGTRFMPTSKNAPVYQDFKKGKIRKNVIKWCYF